MKRFWKKEIVWILLLVFLFIFIRSLHFPYFLNFSTDQAVFSTNALEIWQNKEITLVGPRISFNFMGRYIYQGSIIFYFQLLFLLLANFDPLIGSYLFMIFSSLMLFPLYYGTKWLINKKAALFGCILFTLLPFYIDYTRFFWNVNFQLVLTPILIFFMGLFAKEKKVLYLFLSALMSGILLMFHYQYILVILGLIGYYFLVKRLPLRQFILFLAGVVVGFLPTILFELRNQFYSLQTILLYFSNLNKVFEGKSSAFTYHYFLSASLFLVLGTVYFLRNKLTYKLLLFLAVLLLLVDLVLFVKKPSHAFGMVDDWNYLYEQKAYSIIREQNLQDYNVVNLSYDTLAEVQKYLHRRDSVALNYDDYSHNRYLFIITNKPYQNDPAYEISTFKPAKLIKKWKINQSFDLYLLERIELS